ncbi:MAG: hypothetical protein HY814_05190 [Candidatus Riflebacteria bacterium]|nr:hypothetical protein [Candidatus Riflebacteria bacterium]
MMDLTGEIASLLTKLDERLPGSTTSLSPREVAEWIWLSSALGKVLDPLWTVTGRSVPAARSASGSESEADPAEAAVPTAGSGVSPSVEAEVDFASQDAPRPARRFQASARRLHLTAGLPFALVHPLKMARSIHLLSRWSPVPGRHELDLEATVKQIAATGEWQAVLRPKYERTAHLVLVSDRAAQLEPWNRTLEGLVGLLQRFRSFPSWCVVHADLNDPARVLLRETPEALRISGPEATVMLERAVRPGRENVVLIVSDALGAAFGSGALGALLKDTLPLGSRVALLHPWPAGQWSRSGLRSLRRLEDAPVTPAEFPIATVELNAGGLASLRGWVDGGTVGQLGCHALPVDRAPRGRPARRDLSGPTLDWTLRARQYARNASAEAIQLLALAAAVPGRIDLDLLHALGQHLGSTEIVPFHLAEAIASGFLRRAEVQRRSGCTVLEFVCEDARLALGSYLDRARVVQVLEFLLCRAAASRRESGQGTMPLDPALEIPLGLLFKVFGNDDPEATAAS